MRNIKHLITAILVGVNLISCTAQKQEDYSQTRPIIPTPQEISYGNELLEFKVVSIVANEFEPEGELLKDFFEQEGIEVSSDGFTIELVKDSSKKDVSDEGYALEISDKIVINANTSKGVFYGIQSLKQLIRKEENGVSVPAVTINDWPAFKVRGFMHDTGRNYQTIEQLKEQIEVMAQYKYNIFHWHLTDNPGWRLESKFYPELQSEEATSRHKGYYYTQEEFKDLVDFCKERYITVIPELDIPGHTEAFRAALNIKSMKEPRVLPILKDLFSEMIDLVPHEDMPYVHIGTDEVRNKEEYVSNEFILELMNLIKSKNKELIVWREGIMIPEDTNSINQLWAQHEPREGHRFIDSRSNYINHLDPLAGMARMFFQQPCRQPEGDELALGGVLCAWPDNNVKMGRDILRQNPIYPSMVFYADAIWKGRDKDYKEYWAKLPSQNTPEFDAFEQFEQKVLTHKALYFKEKEFPYVKQSAISWNLIGPFNHGGNVEKIFPVEDEIRASYSIKNEEYEWSENHVGGTIHLKHFFGFESITSEKEGTYYAYTNIYSPDDRIQDFWIGFQGWSRSSRRGGPTANQGEWHYTKPKFG